MSDTVLIVDDSLTVRMNLAEAFEGAGFQTVLCKSIAEAREALLQNISVAVLDVLLPDGDGIDLLTELRADPRTGRMPILVLSTEADVKDRIRGLKTGADEYVGKPYDPKHVVGRARELLRAGGKARDERTSVLIIDDSLTFRAALSETVANAGYSVLTAGTGEEGLVTIANRRPHVVIVDGMLPGIDGATVIRRVRLDAALRGIPCLLLTASDDRDAELHALEAGADAFVRKEEDSEVILAKIAAVLRGTAASRGPDVNSLLGPHTILAVDDSLTYLHSLADVLRDEHYDVVLAHSGEEALDLLSVQPVDCILLDLMMPGMGGREACRRIKSAPVLRDIPLILLTAVEDRSAMLEGLAAGADDYISKSSEFEVLKARVRAQIRRKQFEDENRRFREELLRKELDAAEARAVAKLDAAEARAAARLAETRAALVAELERKNNELEAFSYSVSHDLRAPLRAIDGFSRALLEDCSARLDESGLGHLKRVRLAAQRMGELIDDMLQLSRVTRADLTRREVDLSALAREVVADLRRQHDSPQVEVEIEDGLAADADPRLLRIVLENLFGNAWKFTSHSPAPSVAFRALQGEETTFFVRDNGAGFDMRYAQKLFRPFQRLHAESEFPGTGIGLATIHRVIERHGGRIWADGEVGGGATFTFTLPKGRAYGSAIAA